MNQLERVGRDLAALSTPTLEFFVPGRVAPKGSMVAGKSKQGRLFVRSSTQGRNVERWQTVASTAALFEMRQRELALLAGPLFGVMTFCRVRPRDHVGTAGNVKPRCISLLPETRPDADKLCRAIGDALTNVVYRDDSQLTTVVIRKRWAMREGVLVSIFYDHSDADVEIPNG